MEMVYSMTFEASINTMPNPKIAQIIPLYLVFSAGVVENDSSMIMPKHMPAPPRPSDNTTNDQSVHYGSSSIDGGRGFEEGDGEDLENLGLNWEHILPLKQRNHPYLVLFRERYEGAVESTAYQNRFVAAAPSSSETDNHGSCETAWKWFTISGCTSTTMV